MLDFKQQAVSIILPKEGRVREIWKREPATSGKYFSHLPPLARGKLYDAVIPFYLSVCLFVCFLFAADFSWVEGSSTSMKNCCVLCDKVLLFTNLLSLTSRYSHCALHPQSYYLPLLQRKNTKALEANRDVSHNVTNEWDIANGFKVYQDTFRLVRTAIVIIKNSFFFSFFLFTEFSRPAA